MRSFDLYAQHGFFAAIILDEAGPEWSNQCGGTMCAHPSARGHLFPLPVGLIESEMANRSDDPMLDSWYVPGDEFEPTGPKALDRVAKFLAWSGLDEGAEPDGEHAGPFGEAWVPVKFKKLPAYHALEPLSECRAILTYANSD